MYFLIEKDNHENIYGTYNNDIKKAPDYIKKDYDFIEVNEYLKDCKTEEERIDKALNSVEIYDEHYFKNGYFIIEIIWGDWKHVHNLCDDLMKALGYELVEETLTEENGSDCYSANRKYKKA